MNQTQSRRSVLALIFTVLFLITGKIFIWKSGDKAPAAQVNDPADSGGCTDIGSKHFCHNDRYNNY